MDQDQAIFENFDKHSAKFTKIENHLITNTDLSDSAYRLLTYLLSNSDSWIVYQSYTAKVLGWGRDKLKSAIKQLEHLGYLRREQVRNTDGRFRYYNYKYSKEPIFNSKDSRSYFQPPTEKPSPVKPATANPSLPKPNKPILIKQGNARTVPQAKSSDQALPSSISKEALKWPVEKKTTTPEPSPSQNTLTKPTFNVPKANSSDPIKTIPLASALPFQKTPISQSSRRKPLTEEQETILFWLQSKNIQDASFDTLTYWACNYSLERIGSSIESLEFEIEKGTKFKKSQAAYVRAMLDGKMIPKDSKLQSNKEYAINFAKENKWQSLKIHEKYIVDESLNYDLNLYMPQDDFKTALNTLYKRIQSYS